MGIFDSMVLAVENTSNDFDVNLNRCEIFIEAAYSEYITNLHEAELKVLKESGTKDDEANLKGAASEGFLVRAKKTISKIIENFVKWLKEVGDKVKSFFTKAENKATLDKVEKKIKADPSLKDKKITMGDAKAFDKAESESDARFNKLYARIKAGKADVSDVEKETSAIESSVKESIIKTVTVSAAMAIAFITSHNEKIKEEYEKQQEAFINFEASKIATMSPEELNTLAKAITNHTRIKKQIKYEKFKRCINEPFYKLKGLVTGSKPLPPLDTSDLKKESTDIDDELNAILESAFEEAEVETEFEEQAKIQNQLDDIENKIFNTEESAKTDKGVTVEDYLDALEAAIDEESITSALEHATEQMNKESGDFDPNKYLDSFDSYFNSFK